MKIQSFDFSVDLLRVLLWQYNDAAKLEALVRSKQTWLDTNQRDFWSSWLYNVFDLRTANDFGLAVWAVILGVALSPSQAPDGTKPIWGFGAFREGFDQGNFSSQTSAPLTTAQKRLLLRLRYFQLTTRGAVPEVNAFLKLVFGTIGGPPLAPGIYPQYNADSLSTAKRSGPGTVVPSNGLVTIATPDTARMQYDPASVRTNQFLSSEQLASAPWGVTGAASVASDTTAAPNGVVSADTANLSSTAQVIQSLNAAPTGVYCFSCYLKTAPGNLADNYIQMNCSGAGSTIGAVNINLATGATGVRFGTVLASGATNAGDGWWRVWIVGLHTDPASGLTCYLGSGNAALNPVYAWGGQLETAPGITTPSAYKKTTVAPVSNAATLLGLLVEAAGVNLLAYSSAFSNAAWQKNLVAVTNSTEIAPDGTATASLLTTTVLGDSYLGCAASGAASVIQSVFVKRGNGANVGARMRVITFATVVADEQLAYNFDTDVVTYNNNGGGGGGLLAYGRDIYPNGWVRLWTYKAAQPGQTGCEIRIDANPTGVGNTCRVWGADIRIGETALTSHIPTNGLAAQRTADVMRLPDPNSVGRVYVADSNAMAIAYVFADAPSSAVESVLNAYDILPRPAGVQSKIVIAGESDGYGFGRYHENFSNGNFYH